MEIVDITDWASTEIKYIRAGHVATESTYELKVREFIPKEGDMLQERWVDKDGVEHCKDIPPYAIADMNEAANMFRDDMARNVRLFIEAFVGERDPLLAKTYEMALNHTRNASVLRGEKASPKCTLPMGLLP